MKKILLGLLCLLPVLLLPACAPKKQRFETEYLDLFDTVSRVTIYAESREEFEKQAAWIYAQLKEYHQLYDIYNDYDGIANLKTVNDNAGKSPVKVDKRILDLLSYSREMHEKTSGKMNIAMGSVLSLWHDCREKSLSAPAEALLPAKEALEAAAEHTDISRMILDEAASTVYLADPQMRLDAGAVAKGYALEQVCRQAEEQGLDTAIISLGGTVRTIGEREDGPWRVGIQDPFQPEQITAVLLISERSLATSGTYQRYYRVDGKRYHHIIHPDTLYPADYFESVTILSEDSGQADALSTAVFNLPLSEGMALVESLDGVEALWILPDGGQAESSGLDAYRKKS